MSHGKISIGRRDITGTEMSCRRRRRPRRSANWHRHSIVILGNNNDRFTRSSLVDRH